MIHLIIKPSKIHGKGVFTTENIKAKKIFYKLLLTCRKLPCARSGLQPVVNRQFLSMFKNSAHAPHFSAEFLTDLLDHPEPGCAFIGNNRWISDKKVLNWINHSCDPNTELCLGKKYIGLVAKKDISSGEEITCDYNLTEVGGTKVSCSCGSKRCRGYFLRIE